MSSLHLILLLLHLSPVYLLPLSNTLFQFFQESVLNPDRFIPDVKSFHPEYDFIVVGAGSAGSTLAARLSETSRWSVLLLEAGKDESFVTDIPLTASGLANTSYSWRYRSERDGRSCLGMEEERCHLPKGKVLGGSSVINFMMYTRGSVSDFDTWRDLGNPGWGYDDVLPYFIKAENSSFPGQERGHDGKLSVQRARFTSPLVRTFLEAGFDAGLEYRDVSVRMEAGVSLIQATLTEGERCSASRAYLRPARDRENLYVAQQAQATRVLIDQASRRAYGVVFTKNGVQHEVHARKEVILSAGAINTPQLLMLSGIGPKEHLQHHGIPVVSDLNVGGNLQDHVSMFGLVFLLNDTVSVVENRAIYDPRTAIQYLEERRGPYTLPGGTEALAFLNTKFTSIDDDPDIELIFFPGAPVGKIAELASRAAVGYKKEFEEKIFKPIRGQDCFTILPVLMRPRSRGRVTLRSADPMDAPRVFMNYFQEERDLDTLVEGVKMAVELAESRAFRKYGSRLLPVSISGCEDFLFRSDAYWRCCARTLTNSIHHQSCTCKMGPATDPEAVVDAELRVYGVGGLRVVDASIMPTLPSGHTNSMAIMIGEKAADLIKNTWTTE